MSSHRTHATNVKPIACNALDARTLPVYTQRTHGSRSHGRGYQRHVTHTQGTKVFLRHGGRGLDHPGHGETPVGPEGRRRGAEPGPCFSPTRLNFFRFVVRIRDFSQKGGSLTSGARRSNRVRGLRRMPAGKQETGAGWRDGKGWPCDTRKTS